MKSLSFFVPRFSVQPLTAGFIVAMAGILTFSRRHWRRVASWSPGFWPGVSSWARCFGN